VYIIKQFLRYHHIVFLSHPTLKISPVRRSTGALNAGVGKFFRFSIEFDIISETV